MPKVSVIMNCFNSSEHLSEAIDSVLSQTYSDWEIVFWDNASTDKSGEIALSYCQRPEATCCDKIRYFRAETNTPLGKARNLALTQARGELFAFLDCDDIWHPDKLACQVPLFNDPEVGLACTNTEFFSEAGTLSFLFEKTRPARGRVFRELVQNQWISMSSAMISRQALKSLDRPENGGGWFDENLDLCEEADVFYRIAKNWKLDFVPAADHEALTRWRVHVGSTTFAKFGKFAEETLYLLEKHQKLYPNYNTEYPELVSLLQERAAFQRAVSLWREGKGSAARECIRPYISLKKCQLLWIASWMPGCLFDPLSSLYFRLPKWLRR